MCRAVLSFSCMAYVAFIVTENMSCVPYKKIWDKTILEGYCINSRIFHIPGALLSPTTITIILVLPQKPIWSLQMSMKNKIGISLIFLVGLL